MLDAEEDKPALVPAGTCTEVQNGGAAPSSQGEQNPEEEFEKLLRDSQQERNATRGTRTKLASKSSAKSTPYGTWGEQA